MGGDWCVSHQWNVKGGGVYRASHQEEGKWAETGVSIISGM